MVSTITISGYVANVKTNVFDQNITDENKYFFSMYVNVGRNYKDKRSNEYLSDGYSCKVFGKSAANMAKKNFQNGDIALVKGVMEHDQSTYTGDQGQEIKRNDWFVRIMHHLDVLGPLQLVKRENGAQLTQNNNGVPTFIAQDLPKMNMNADSQQQQQYQQQPVQQQQYQQPVQQQQQQYQPVQQQQYQPVQQQQQYQQQQPVQQQTGLPQGLPANMRR